MLIEVTEREAHGIYAQRFLDKPWHKLRWDIVLGISALIALISFALISIYINEWLGLVVGVLLLSPAFYFAIRMAKLSGKYARKQIEGQNPILTGVKERLKKKERIFEEIG